MIQKNITEKNPDYLRDSLGKIAKRLKASHTIYLIDGTISHFVIRFFSIPNNLRLGHLCEASKMDKTFFKVIIYSLICWL